MELTVEITPTLLNYYCVVQSSTHQTLSRTELSRVHFDKIS